jgi:hypothetical protein
MTTFTRWRLATPLLLLSTLCLAATLIGAWAYWAVDDTAERAITVFLAVMYATTAGISISIGTDRTLNDTPWARIGAITLLFLLSCGVAIVRRNL